MVIFSKMTHGDVTFGSPKGWNEIGIWKSQAARLPGIDGIGDKIDKIYKSKAICALYSSKRLIMFDLFPAVFF